MNLDRAAKPGNKKLSLVLALMSLCLSLSCPLVGAEAKSKPELLLAKKAEEPKDEESKSAGKKEKSEKSKEKVEKTAREEKAEKTEKAENSAPCWNSMPTRVAAPSRVSWLTGWPSTVMLP